jgi:hypothetical protein
MGLTEDHEQTLIGLVNNGINKTLGVYNKVQPLSHPLRLQ